MALTPEGGLRKWLNNYPEWLAACEEKHDGKYTYPTSERVKDSNGQWKIEIICPEHGPFLQSPARHKGGQGCPACSKNILVEHPVAWAREKYPECDWEYQEKATSKSILAGVCRHHGEFSTNLNRLKEKYKKDVGMPACPRCAKSSAGLGRRKPPEVWAEEIKAATGGDLDLTTLSVSTETARVVCSEHGEWWARPQDLIRGHGCPECWKGAKRSKGEQELCDWLESRGAYIIENVGFNLPELGKQSDMSEYDVAIQVKDTLLLIDYHGVYFHGDKIQMNNNWHLDKWNKVNVDGVRYIQIFEDEWAFKRDIVKARLLHLLGQSDEKRYARKLEVVKIQWGAAGKFFEDTHIQGAGTKTGENWALLDGEDIVACMSFSAPRFDKSVDVEMLRYASRGAVVGGFSRLLNAFLRSRPDVKTVGTYADKRWSSGEVYAKHGFELTGHTQPGYAWYKNLQRVSRHRVQRKILKTWLPNYDPNKTEVENMRANGFWRVFDAGSSRWVLTVG